MISTSSPTATKTILIVDDHENMVNLWKMKLERMNFVVTTGKDGVEALDAMKAKKFDAILLDLYMPRKGGFDVLSEKGDTLNADTPTFIITSTMDESDLDMAKHMGARDAFLKYRSSPKEVITAITAEM